MNETQKEIDQAFRLLSAISVAGGAVEAMAAAKEHLRRAYALAAGQKERKEKVAVDG